MNKLVSFTLKGFILPFLIIAGSLITSIVFYENTGNVSCGKITGYLDDDLYTDAAPILDSSPMNILIVFLLFFFLFNYCNYKGLIRPNETAGKSAYYIANSVLSVGAPLIGLLWLDFPVPEIPANVFLFNNSQYIELDHVSITYLQDEKNKIRIIMATEQFQGYESYLAQGPWMIPFSFSWMNGCVAEFVKIQDVIRTVYIVLLCCGSFLAFISMYISFLRYRNTRVADESKTEEEKKTFI